MRINGEDVARIGKCALTGKTGKLVKSHLIPRALTDIGEPGEPYYEAGKGARVQRKWSSWYDPSLVIRAGEDILADLDARGIAALRHSKLIWSAWDTEDELGIIVVDDHPMRTLINADAASLRMFILSLLWRAAASGRVEFAEIQLPEEDLQQLGDVLRRGEPPPLNFYPTSLLQYSTKGPPHNRAPDQFRGRREDGGPTPAFRFYFEGLVVHIYSPLSDEQLAPLRSLLVGGDDQLAILTMPFEKSAQLDGLRMAATEATTQWYELGYNQ